jgi:tRNA pseudouridine32 synthase/23S rRNA pseudouridine746 synthase
MKTFDASSSSTVCTENGMEEKNAVMRPLCEGLVYVDEQVLVLDKPAGLLAVPGRGADKQDCLSARAQRLWPDALVVHRLDMATSGLVVMGRGLEMQRRLGLAFEQRRVDKRYVAVVAGHVAEDSGTIELPVGADWPRRPMQKVDADAGKPSTTRWVRLPASPERDGGTATTRLELEPLTGRTHQLRVHLQAIDHPILGDALYAPPGVQQMAPRLLLHASFLGFAHPATGERIELESRAPF